MKNEKKALALALSGITQLGISVVVSFILWILIASWVKNTFNLGNYVMVIGVLCGAGSAGISFYSFCKKATDTLKKEDENEN